MSPVYAPCSYPVGPWESEKTCGRPVSLRKLPRCSEHRARLPYWPVEEDADCFCKPGAVCACGPEPDEDSCPGCGLDGGAHDRYCVRCRETGLGQAGHGAACVDCKAPGKPQGYWGRCLNCERALNAAEAREQ